MKKLVLAALVSGQINLTYAEIVIQAGEQKFIFADSEKDSELVKGFTKYAENENRGLELHKKREQIKDEMGLGELERMMVSGTEPSPEDILKYRGGNTDQLFTLLETEIFSGYWREIARTIGMVADEESLKSLAAFATTAFPQDHPANEWHVKAREGAVWGLALANRDQPIPWIKEFLVSHADADRWVQDVGEDKLDQKVAEELAKNTRRMISRMGNDESLAMLEEVRVRRTSKTKVRPASLGASAPDGDKQLEHIDTLIKQTRELAKLYTEHAEQTR